MEYSKYIIGIDLGTTNTAVTYIDLEEKVRETKVFKITQLSAPGETDNAELLPSFCFFPDQKLITKNSTDFHWSRDLDYTVGIYARNYGSAMPNRFISSTKSWLCHAGVDRRKNILPWGSSIEEIKKSPLEITSYYLKHIKDAWDFRFSKNRDVYNNKCFFADQSIVITVPASFDETARELTIEAAELAGYRNIKLLEEPLAAFYSWLDKEQDSWKEHIQSGDKVLVMDVGGGTCDFSLIEMDNDEILSRTAAGNHLLLGGDNIDIAMARNIEKNWNKKLSHGEWLTLCQKTREAKETLLNNNADSVEVILLSQGSSIIGGSRKATIRREELEELLNKGFIPEINIDSKAPTLKTGLQTMGLPYVSEPALTKHLLQFLRYSYKVAMKTGSCNKENSSEVLCPNKILFNGGTLIPEVIRKRIVNIVQSWFPDNEIEELESRDLSLAVSFGASYYGRTKLGDGVKVKSGTALSYYIQIDDTKDKEKLICIMPRGIDEGIVQNTDKLFTLTANKKVKFPLCSSATRIGDKPGDIIDLNDEITFVSSLETALKFGKSTSHQNIKSNLYSILTETGVLKIFLKSAESTHNWPLNFDTRLIGDDLSESEVGDRIVIDQENINKALEEINSYFKAPANSVNIVKQIEAAIELNKKEWPLQCLRKFADNLLEIPYSSLKLPAKEAKWLNLLGYCLRPGFGDPEDGMRMKKIWSLWYKGMNNKNNASVATEWWIFWRRTVSGLNNGHQRTIYQELTKNICPKGKYIKNIKSGVQVKAEMWRCYGALELLPLKNKQEMAKALLSHADKMENYEYWVMARLGNRHLFHAPANNVVPADIAEQWLTKLLKAKNNTKALNEKLFAVSCIAKMTDNRAINLKEPSINSAVEYLQKNKASVNWIEHLKSAKKESITEQGRIAGDSLPLGLSLEQ